MQCLTILHEYPKVEVPEPEQTCTHPRVGVDPNTKELYCEECDVILLYYDLAEEDYFNQSVIVKPKINGVKKTFDSLGITLEPYQLNKIEQEFKTVTEGKIKKGKPRRSILAVCYIVEMQPKVLKEVLDIFKTNQTYFIVGLRAYEAKFGPVDFTQMEVPTGFLSCPNTEAVPQDGSPI